MGKSPGHQKWPDHKVEEQHLDQTISLEVDGDVVAESRDVILVAEDDHPPRYYFPRTHVAMAKLTRSETTSQCPFKGTAHYYSVRSGDKVIEDAVWTYEEPFDEHQALKGRLAFYVDELAEISVVRKH